MIKLINNAVICTWCRSTYSYDEEDIHSQKDMIINDLYPVPHEGCLDYIICPNCNHRIYVNRKS